MFTGQTKKSTYMCNFEGREGVTDEWITTAVLSLARMEKVFHSTPCSFI